MLVLHSSSHGARVPHETTPFSPGQAVPFDRFVGRAEAIEDLLELAGKAAKGRFTVSFLAGDRGIGKTSLARFVTFLAERDHDLLGLHVVLGGVADAAGLVHQIFDRLANVAQGSPLWERIEELFTERVRPVGPNDVRVDFRPNAEELETLTDEFAFALHSVIGELHAVQKRGLCIVLDDMEGLASTRAFAAWLSALARTVAEGVHHFPVFLLFVGSHKVLWKLGDQDPRLARVFHPVDVLPWSPEDTSDFYRRAFGHAGMTVAQEARKLMVEFAGGSPALAHEIGDAAFRLAGGRFLSKRGAERAIMAGTLVIAHKYFVPRLKVLRDLKGSETDPLELPADPGDPADPGELAHLGRPWRSCLATNRLFLYMMGEALRGS